MSQVLKFKIQLEEKFTWMSAGMQLQHLESQQYWHSVSDL